MAEKKRVLIVEDESTSRRLLAHLLQGFATCNFASTGGEAVDEIDSALREGRPYDLVCLDLMLPDKSGFDVLVEMRQLEVQHGGRGAEQPVVVCTAIDDVAFVKKAFRQQCAGYIVKPFEKEKVLGTLRRIHLLED